MGQRLNPMSSPTQDGRVGSLAKSDMDALEQMLADSPSAEQVCLKLARGLHVHRDEVALFRLEKNSLRFVFPVELRAAGLIPLSGPAIAARTASTRHPMFSNSFARVKHARLFETVRLGGEDSEGPQQMPIQKLMSVPVTSPDGNVLGVVQVSRKGLDASLAGEDFTSEDVKQLERAAAILARMPFMQPGAEL